MGLFRSFGKRCLGLIVSLLLVVNCLPVSHVFAASSQSQAQSLDADINVACAFYNNFEMVFYAKIKTPGNFTDVRLEVNMQEFPDESDTYTWESRVIRDYTYNSETSEYRFVYHNIAAAEMVNVLQIKLCANLGSTSYETQTKEVSIKDYAMYLIEASKNSTNEEEVKLCSLLVDMLLYGEAAQLYFGRNTGNLASAALTDEEKSFSSKDNLTISSCLQVGELPGAVITMTGVSIVFDTSAELVIYAEADGDLPSGTYAEISYTDIEGEKIVHKVTSDKFTYLSGSKEYRIAFDKIAAVNFRVPLTIVFKSGNDVLSPALTYSYESYADTVRSGNYPQTLKDLVNTLMAYSESAKKYFQCVFGIGGQEQEDDLSTYKNSQYTTDMPQAVIVIPASATAEEQYAASLLAKYIAQEDGYTPSVISDANSSGSNGFEISVGNTNRPHSAPTSNKEGAYRIRSYDGGIAIIGNGQRGTIDGAMKFLSLCGGYFWLSFEDGYKTNQTHFKYSDSIDVDHERAFEFTDIDVHFGKTDEGDNRMFSLAGALNGFYVNVREYRQPGYQSWYLTLADEAAYGGLQPGQAHTLLAEYITPDNFDAHNDWFALATDDWETYSRQPVQLCMTNPEVYEKIREHVFDILENGNYDPDAPMQIISLSQADNKYVCMCSDCVHFRMEHEAEGSKEGLCEGAVMLDVCNRISQEVKDAGYENVYIDMLAYTYTLKAPVNMTADDHVIIRYAAINRCYAHDVDDTACERNKEDVEYLKGWAKICRDSGARLWIWDYNINFQTTLGPYLNIGALTHDIKYYRDLGVSGIYLQSNDVHSSINTEFGDLRNYLGLVLLENPDADIEKEMAFFANEFYGKSGSYILEAMKIMEDQAKNHGNVGPNHDPETNNWYWRGYCMTYNVSVAQMFANYYPEDMDAQNQMDPADFERCEALWDQALAAASEDTARHQFVTGRTHLCWRIVKSTMHVDEFADPSTYRQRNQELFDDIFGTYKTKFYSLIIRGKPGVPYLDHCPDRWCNTEDYPIG